MSDTTNLPAHDARNTIETVLDRHRAFWQRRETDRPLLGLCHWTPWKPYPSFVVRGGAKLEDGAELVPRQLDIAANLDPNRPAAVQDGDFINSWGPYDSCWSEAILGCRVRRYEASVFSEPFIHNWDEIDRIPHEGSSGWIEELSAVNDVLIRETKGVLPICQPLLRGPLDMAEAAVPTDMLYPGFIDHPEAMRRLLEVCTDIFIGIAQRWLRKTPRYFDGYAVRHALGLWAPGATVLFQADAMRNLSAQMYRDFLLEIDQRIASQFEYPIIHTHSCSAHILPVLAETPALRVIQVSLDPAPFGPPPLSLLPKFQQIQEGHKSLLIDGPMERPELEILLKTLSPVGLAIRTALPRDESRLEQCSHREDGRKGMHASFCSEVLQSTLDHAAPTIYRRTAT
jgi:hypothetical protein